MNIQSTGFFTVVFKRLSTPKLPPKLPPQAELTKLEGRIIAEIKANPKISRKELAKKISISQDTVKEYLEKLKSKGAIRRIGMTSAGYWETIT